MRVYWEQYNLIKGIHIIIIKRKNILFSFIFLLVCFGFIQSLLNFYSTQAQPAISQSNTNYIILAANNLGMHCYEADYSSFMILPPGNTLRVQIFQNEGSSAELINSGITVTYQIIDNTTSIDKTNFWEYAKDYGYNLEPNIGITGNGLSGKMELSKDRNYYEATAIPITPYSDGSKELNPYQLAVITVSDNATGTVLAKTDNVVVPVSDEMLCSTCHGTIDTGRNILTAHDKNSNTAFIKDLDAGIRHRCSECHQDNALGEEGLSNVLSLSEAMHGFHADKMSSSNINPECYSCHPGPVTQCYRSIMYKSGIDCVNSKCHGDMKNVAATQANGRVAWFDEPNCSNCHGNKYSANTGLLYSESYLENHSNPEMNGFILCTSCHNSPHAEWPSANWKDNLLPSELLGYSSFINKCSVCHEGTGMMHEKELK